MRYKHVFSVVMVDADGLKAVNDKYGHSAGDTSYRFFTLPIRPGLTSHHFYCTNKYYLVIIIHLIK